MDIHNVGKWATPATQYPTRKLGKAQIKRIGSLTGGAYHAEGVEGKLWIEYGRGSKITTLSIDGNQWMSDDWQFTRSLDSFAERSKGKVLVAGLGLGLVIHALVKNPQVTEIVVVERELDVIRLVGPHLPKDERIKVLHDDFYRVVTRYSDAGIKPDTVIWDLCVRGPSGFENEVAGLFLTKPLMLAKFGMDEKQVFVHGLDRDPVGEKFVRDNPGKLHEARMKLTELKRQMA